MYSTTIKPKIKVIFNDLKDRASSVVLNSTHSDEALNRVTKLVNSELKTRSKSLLSDMLFALSDKLMETEFFSDISRQNKFDEINLRHEILSKYQFTPKTLINYKEVSKIMQASKVGGLTLIAGTAIGIGAILIADRPFSSLTPIPISILVVASIGTALADYYVIESKRSKKNLSLAINDYLIQTEQQFLKWFDEIENYFNMRIEEIKKSM